MLFIDIMINDNLETSRLSKYEYIKWFSMNKSNIK